MSTLDKINEILKSYQPHEFDPVGFLDGCRQVMGGSCAPGGEHDPRQLDSAQAACNAYGGIANMLLENGFRSAAQSILIDAWNEFGNVQREEKQRIYRAGLAYYLAKMYLRLNDKGSALRWALLTQADDILGEHGEGGGAGKQMLLTVLGMSNRALAELNSIASDNVSKIKASDEPDWSHAIGFAEDVITKFALEKPEFAHLFSAASSMFEFPISNAYYSALLDSVRAEGVSSQEKGDALEDLSSYLFLLIPGWVPRRNLVDEYLSFETDLVVRNLNPSSNITAELLGRHFLVECKNWEKPVGVSDVGYFLYRMRLTHARFGVIFARSGITGTEENERAAHSIIRKAFHEDGNICIVLAEHDLASLLSEQLSFWSVLLEKIERVRFGKPTRNTAPACKAT